LAGEVGQNAGGESRCRLWYTTNSLGRAATAGARFTKSKTPGLFMRHVQVPASIIEKYKPIAEGMTFCGIPATDLTRDELLAAIGVQHEDQKRQERDAKRNLSMERSFTQFFRGRR
jgi:hypothetical protein